MKKNFKLHIVRLVTFFFCLGAIQFAIAVPSGEGEVYIVQKNESLSKIAKKFYGDASLWRAIQKATNEKIAEAPLFRYIGNAGIIRIGQRLWIPGPEIAAKLAGEAAHESAEIDGGAYAEGKEHTIQYNESLSKLAKKLYGSFFKWPAIWKATNEKSAADQRISYLDDPNKVRAGQIVWLPETAEVSELMAAYDEAQTGHASTTARAPHKKDKRGHHKPHWGYKDKSGAGFWACLSDAFEVCGLGKSQSPINIETSRAVSRDIPDVFFSYQSSNLRIVNNGHTIQVNYDNGSYITIEGKRFDLLQFHFHNPSEHTINDQYVPMEMHLVHKNAQDNQLAVVGVMLNNGKENEALQAIWKHLPKHKRPEIKIEQEIDAAQLLPAKHTVYRYSGSLTTPPCSENVIWNVMAEPLEMSSRQINTFTDIFSGNNRPIQPLNGRQISIDLETISLSTK